MHAGAAHETCREVRWKTFLRLTLCRSVADAFVTFPLPIIVNLSCRVFSSVIYIHIYEILWAHLTSLLSTCRCGPWKPFCGASRRSPHWQVYNILFNIEMRQFASLYVFLITSLGLHLSRTPLLPCLFVNVPAALCCLCFDISEREIRGKVNSSPCWCFKRSSLHVGKASILIFYWQGGWSDVEESSNVNICTFGISIFPPQQPGHASRRSLSLPGSSICIGWHVVASLSEESPSIININISMRITSYIIIVRPHHYNM